MRINQTRTSVRGDPIRSGTVLNQTRASVRGDPICSGTVLNDRLRNSVGRFAEDRSNISIHIADRTLVAPVILRTTVEGAAILLVMFTLKAHQMIETNEFFRY